MSYPDDAAIWQDFVTDWGTWFPEVFATPAELDTIAGDVPRSWITAVRNPDAGAATDELWQSAALGLPRFYQFLANETTRLAIARGRLGYILVYFVQSCSEESPGVYHPGFIFGGPPTPDMLVDEFARLHGGLPRGLMALWRVHGFFRTKEESTVSSLLPGLAPFAGTPRQLPAALHAPSDETDGLECLAVIDAARPSQVALTRGPGARDWTDSMVRTFSNNPIYLPVPWAGIDGLLTDWTSTDYRPPATPRKQ